MPSSNDRTASMIWSSLPQPDQRVGAVQPARCQPVPEEGNRVNRQAAAQLECLVQAAQRLGDGVGLGDAQQADTPLHQRRRVGVDRLHVRGAARLWIECHARRLWSRRPDRISISSTVLMCPHGSADLPAAHMTTSAGLLVVSARGGPQTPRQICSRCRVC